MCKSLPGLFCHFFIFLSQVSFEDHNIYLLIIVGCNNLVLHCLGILFWSYLSHVDLWGFNSNQAGVVNICFTVFLECLTD